MIAPNDPDAGINDCLDGRDVFLYVLIHRDAVGGIDPSLSEDARNCVPTVSPMIRIPWI